MDANYDPDEDHLISYDVQLSIQESTEASKAVFYPERFVLLSDQKRKLVEAIKQGHILELQEYVKYKYVLDEADEKGWFPLHEAVVQPIRQVLEVVLDASYKTLWELKTSDGETPLTLAVKAGLVENVRTLLEKGVWPNTKNDKGETPLLLAVKKGSYDMVSALLKHHTSLDQPCVKQWSAMHEAAKQGRKDIIALLLNHRGSVHLRDGFGVTPLGVAAEYGHCDVLEHLIHKGGDVLALADDGASVLLEAAGGGNPDCVSLLLEYGGSGNIPNRAGHLPIHRAAYEGHYLAIQYALNDEVMLRLLLNNGYQVEMCFDCMHGDIFGNSFVWSEIEEEVLPGWTSCVVKDNPFCEFITVPWMKHLVGSVIRVLMDYMDYIPLCAKLKSALEVQREWPEIRQILENPCSLKHLCRLRIRRLMGLQRLCQPASMEKLPLPPTIQRYILFKEYDLYGQELKLP
ncbi:ankyrin repeat and SOCS box protein 15 isoform X3 [Physeter macrocephalus]|uniref:Ankyrin repeat and SOCS box protein 15 isoform X3 n=1 Tax=Physeter macrocephalus TaxID=9755 RepID=A0A455BA84_PHYMC|nr:ankyrin repeat and SOCS box protein 15 isoform X3 [Physeter catodon]|eukprot:XP_028345604.1 ankyrin repeat and SOCS box protein 15 isoform X3 [Physeter catodon]